MPRSYTTTQGDMWDGIARKTLGSEYLMTQLLEANPCYREIVIFPANIVLAIPDVETGVSPDNLPPWKR